MNLLNLNIHPILVHFPIALLSLYSFLEIISFRSLRKNEHLFVTKSILVTLGGISLLIARQTGQMAGDMITDPNTRSLLHAHENYGNISTAIYGIIAAGYVVAIFKKWMESKIYLQQFLPIFKPFFILQQLLTETFVIKLFAIAGFAALLITGALGGSIVYGPSLDPLTHFLYSLVMSK